MSESKCASRIAGLLHIPIHVHGSWVVVFALLAWAYGTASAAPYTRDALPFSWITGVAACVLLFVSVLLHEMGHAIVAQAHGLTIRSITLFVFGGVAQMEKGPENGRTELRIAAAGPVVSLGLTLLFYLAASLPFVDEGWRAVAWDTAGLNLGLAVLNVLPAFPGDGGRMLRGLLWTDRGAQRATVIASEAGQLLAVVIVGVAAYRLFAQDRWGALSCALFAWLLNDAAVAASARVRLHDVLRGLAVRDAMLADTTTVPAHLPVSELSPRHLLRGGLHLCPVMRGNHIVGVLAVREALSLSPAEQRRTSVQAVMTPLDERLVTRPDDSLLDAMARLTRSGAGPLLVVQDGRLQGMLSVGSVLRHNHVREALSS